MDVSKIDDSKLKVTIVILNWNGWKDTIECLESLAHLTSKNFSVIVVDNASTDESRQKLMEWGAREQFLKFKSVMDQELLHDASITLACGEWLYIQSASNAGFAGGNNLGIQLAIRLGCEYVWLLNNDTTVVADTMDALVRRVQLKPNIGMCGSLLCFYHRPDTVQAVGGVSFDFNRARGMQIGQGLTVNDAEIPALANIEPTYIAGASMLMPIDFLKEVGLMEESYFLYFEEIDWAVRAGAWKTATALDSVVYHKEGASIGTASLAKRSSLSQYYLHRNLIRFYALRKPHLLPIALVSVFKELLKRLYFKDWVLAKVTSRAMLDGLMMRSGKTF